MDIAKYKALYEAHDWKYREYLDAYRQANIPVRFPIAREILIDLTDRMDDIYQGMLLMGHTNNLTSLHVLYRSLMDHFIKIQYIQDKTFTGLSDETAHQYKVHYSVHEFLGEQGGIIEMDQIIDETKPKPDKPTYLQNKFPEMAGFDKNNEKEISAAVKQFGLSVMVKHLRDRFHKLPGTKNGGNILAQILPEFARVSSFTHGGPYAGQILQTLKEAGTVEEQIHNQLNIGLTMIGSCKEHNLLVFEIDLSVQEILHELKELRKIV